MFKKITFATISLVTLFTLAACGQNNNDTTDSSKAGDTRELTDSMDHKVEVPDKPKRIIASYLEDYLVALDETPVAQWTVGNDSDQAYLQDQLKDVPKINYDLPYEDVLSFNPDLLLIGSNATVEGGKYKQYNKIAPTYVVTNGDNVTWEDQLNDIAKVLNKEDKAKEVEADYKDLIETTKNDLADKIEGKSAAVIWVTNNSAFMVAENRSSGRLLYSDLGFEVPELTKDISTEATSDWTQVSLESLSQLDADYLFLVNSDEGAELFNDDLWKNIPAVQNNQLFSYGAESSWLYNGPIAYTEMAKDVTNALK